ncbi:hypothetical protein ABPG73_020887 [Tetrahymena malaccensis]
MRKLLPKIFAIMSVIFQQIVSQECSIGCSICSVKLNSEVNTCDQCLDGYILGNNNNCVYQSCQPYLYLQNDEDNFGNCSSICNPLSYVNTQTKTCENLVQCQQIYSTLPNFQNSGIPIDFFIYQQSYYVALQQGYLSIYDRNGLGLIKNLSFMQDDQAINNVNGIIIVLRKDFSISVWEIISENRLSINQSDLIFVSDKSQFNYLLNQFIILLNIEAQMLQFQAFYDNQSQQQLISNAIQINQATDFISIIYNYILMGNETNLIFYQVNFSSDYKNVNISDPIIFTFENYGEIQDVIQLSNQNIFFSIFKNIILEIDLESQNSSKLIQLSSIQKVKIILLDNPHLIILTNQNLIDFNYLTDQQNIINNNQEIVSDFEVGNFSGINDQLIVLLNLSQLLTINFNKTQQGERQQLISLNLYSQYLNKMSINQSSMQPESQTKYEIAVISSDQIQILKQSMITQSILELDVIENFNLPFPTPSAQVNQLIQVFSPPILISCHQNGDIIFYDASKGINLKLIQVLSFKNQSCIQIQRFNDNKIAAQVGSNVLLIDPSQQIIQNQLTNVLNILQISSNYDKLALSYNNCIQIISSDFLSLFKECSTYFSSDNIKIALNNDLKIVLQKQYQILVYQIQFDTQQALMLNQIQIKYQINYFGIIEIFNSESDIILNNYSIDEIVFFDGQSNFSICDMSLSISHTENISLLSNIYSVKRVINDTSVYFLAGFQFTQGQNSIFLVAKNLNNSLFIHTIPYQSFILEPKKLVNRIGNTFYSIKQAFQLSFYTVIEEFQVDISRNITYVGGHDYINIDQGSVFISNMIGSSLNFLNYIGTESGIIYSAKYQKERYQQIINQNILSSVYENDQIIEIIQSAQLGRYFIRTNHQIASFNIFTDQFIELLIPQQQKDSPFSSFSLVQENLGIVCWNVNELLYVFYGNQSQKYYYQGIKKINGWIIDASSNNFYIYGSSFQILNSELKLLKTLSSNYSNTEFIQCQDTELIVICSISINQFSIIQKQTNQIMIQYVQVNGFTNQFQISVDEEYQNIFLYSDQIQIYNFNGIKSKQFTLQTQFISFSIISDSILFQSNSYIYFIERISLELNSSFIQAPSGLIIENYIYIDFLEYIVLYTNLSAFAQIYIYDTSSLQNVAQINGSFSSNLIGNVVDMFFDYSSALITYLDAQGNVYVHDLFGDFSIQSNYKINEIYDLNEQLVGFSYDNITNNLLVYSTNSIYKIDYSLAGFIYEAQLEEPNKLFTSIPINNQSLEFLFFNNDNILFRYSNYKINFENIINAAQISDLIYNINYDTLIIALKDSIIFYNNYQLSKTNGQLPQNSTLIQIKFFKFLQQNIILTYDKKVIYFNILTGQIIDYAQIQNSVIVTCYKSSTDQTTILVGLSNGQVLQYDLNDLSQHYYGTQNTNLINTSIISINIAQIQGQSLYAYLVTNGGTLLVVDINNKQIIQQLDLINLVQEDPLITLKDFVLDITHSRFIFIFNGQKKVYVWNFQINQIEQYLALTKDQGNKIQLHSNMLITFCTFQLNIYFVSDQISLIGVIKRNFANDQITNYQVINDNIIVIFFIQKYEVFLIQNKTNRLIYQEQYSYPKYLGYIYNQQDNLILLYGLHKNGVFENSYSISMYENDYVTNCATIISDNNISQLNQKISKVKPKQNIQNSIYGSQVYNQKDWTNVIYLQVTSEQFVSVNSYINQNQLVDSVYLFYPQQNRNNFTLNNETLYSFQQPALQIFNYNFIFQNINEQNLVTLNKNVQNFTLMNITITEQCIENIQIQIQSIQMIIFQSVKISKLYTCNNSTQNQQQTFLFNFFNISQIFIYNLEISMLAVDLSQNYALFNISNINDILIDGVNGTNNQNIKSFFQFTQVKNITINNTNINNNQYSKNNNINGIRRSLQQQIQIENLESNSIFNFFGCLMINFVNSQFFNNSQMHLITSINQQIQNNQLTVLFDDSQLSFVQSHENQNSLISKPFSNFRQRYDQSKEQGILNFMNDFILEQSDYNEALEELDPKKVQNYSFSAKSSIFNYHENNETIL